MRTIDRNQKPLKLIREKSSNAIKSSSSNKNLVDSKKLERTRTVGKLNPLKPGLTQSMTTNNIKKRDESQPKTSKATGNPIKFERNGTSKNPISIGKSGEKKLLVKQPTAKGNLKSSEDLKKSNSK